MDSYVRTAAHKLLMSLRLKGKKKSQAHKDAMRKPKTDAHKQACRLAALRSETKEKRKRTMLQRYGIEKVSFDYDLNEKEETQLMKDYYL